MHNSSGRRDLRATENEQEPRTRRPPACNVSRRQLNIIFIVDCSGSMAGEKINSLNMAMRIAEKELRKAAASNISVDMMVRVLRFSTGAQWHMEGPVTVADFEWTDLAVDHGETEMGSAPR